MSFSALGLCLFSILSSAGVASVSEDDALLEKIDRFIRHEMQAKDLPALSIAIVEDQEILWEKGFGLEKNDPPKNASPHSVYRVGSVSKLFTDIAIMQLVEEGLLDLDGKIQAVLPDFDSDKEVTLRQLMAHRAGLVREPPIGHYFDADEPSLEKTVDSLQGTPTIYPPGSRIKYSNAGVAVVGRVLEKLRNAPLRRRVGQGDSPKDRHEEEFVSVVPRYPNWTLRCVDVDVRRSTLRSPGLRSRNGPGGESVRERQRDDPLHP